MAKTRSEVDAIIARARQFTSPYITEHLGYLELALRDYESYKSENKKREAWQKVEREARKIENKDDNSFNTGSGQAPAL